MLYIIHFTFFSGDEIDVSGIVFRWTNIVIGIQSSLIVLPINIFIVTLFRRAAPLPKKQLKKDPENPRKLSQNSNAADNTLNCQLLGDGKEMMLSQSSIVQKQQMPQQKRLLSSHMHSFDVKSDYNTAPNSLLSVDNSLYKETFTSFSTLKGSRTELNQVSLGQIELGKFYHQDEYLALF